MAARLSHEDIEARLVGVNRLPVPGQPPINATPTMMLHASMEADRAGPAPRPGVKYSIGGLVTPQMEV